MGKKPSIHILGNLKKKIINKPVKAQRVFISDAQKAGFKKEAESLDEKIFEAKDYDPNEDLSLEDTPIGDVLINGNQKNVVYKKEQDRNVRVSTGKLPHVNYDTEKRFNIKQSRYKKNNRSFLRGLIDKIKYLPSNIRSPKSNSAALDFAGSGKRLTKKDKRNRHIIIYGGTGVLIVAVALIIIFTSGKGVTSVNNSTAPSTVTTEALVSSTVSPSPVATERKTISPTETLSPTPTVTPVATTPPEITPVPLSINDEVKTFQVKSNKDDPYYSKMGYSSNHYKYTDNELNILANVIYGEARGESYAGQVAVGNVVMNRVLNRSNTWGNTISAVVTQGQFHGYIPGRDTPRSSTAWRAARDVLDNEYWVIPQNAYYFRGSDSTSNLSSSVVFYKTIDNQSFYIQKRGGRSNVKSVPPQLFQRTYQWPEYGCKPDLRVYKIQYMLNQLNYDVTADKNFGQDTVKAIQKFQKDHKIKADGIAGSGTIKALIKAYCNKFGEAAYYNKFCK